MSTPPMGRTAGVIKRNKNNAKRTLYRGHWYASKLEAQYAAFLNREKSEGRILDWTPHPFRMPLVVNGTSCGTYTPDFHVAGVDGTNWIVDTKGKITREWPFRKKIIMACHPEVDLRVVRSGTFPILPLE